MKLPVFIIFLFILTISCSDNNEVQQSQMITTHAGSVYFACDVGPYTFSLDSLKSNCSQGESILDDLSLGQLTLNDSSVVRCTYDYDFESLSNDSWDFQILRSPNNLIIFELEMADNTLIPTTIFSTTLDGQIYNTDDYPFYTAYEIDLDSNTQLDLYLFNVYVGGCLHDLLVWELKEN